MKEKTHILLAEDEPNFGSVLCSYLKLANYEVDWCKDGAMAYARFQQKEFHLCIFDVMMPNMDGFQLAQNIRSSNSSIPIIFLTAKSLKEDVLKGFKLGADDYLTKPFDSDILLEKIRVLLERSKITSIEQEQSNYTIGKFNFKVSSRVLSNQQYSHTLSPKESALLLALCKNKNLVLKRSQALNEIWGDDNYFTARSMDVYVAKLRKYLKEDECVSIVNIHGDGFQLNCS